MNNNEYYIEALQAETYKKLDWIIDCFTITDYPVFEDGEFETFYPYQLVRSANDKDALYFVDGIEESITKLEEYTPDKALFSFKDRISLLPNDLPNVVVEVETNYGNVLVNAFILCYAFGNKIPFITGRIEGRDIEEQIVHRLKEYIPGVDVDTRDKNFIYVDELVKHNDAVSALEGLCMIAVPSVSLETMVPTPGVLELRDKLLKQYANELDNPAVIADIMSQLAAHEKASLKGTSAEGFYTSGKSYDVIRMKRFIMYGLEGGLGGGEPHLITRSLKEGWDMEQFPAMVDGLRGGSYSRGIETAVGGEWVKHFQRVFQNIKVIEPDCGAVNGMSWPITQYNFKRFIGLYQITNNGVAKLDEQTCKNLIGSTIKVRTPMLCNTIAPNFCETCCGEAISASANALHSVTAEIGSVFMLSRMKNMHGKATQTREYDYKNAIS